jgi:hypothetical protein
MRKTRSDAMKDALNLSMWQLGCWAYQTERNMLLRKDGKTTLHKLQAYATMLVVLTMGTVSPKRKQHEKINCFRPHYHFYFRHVGGQYHATPPTFLRRQDARHV